MRTFRGYVSPAQEGILSATPEAGEHERSVTFAEARERCAGADRGQDPEFSPDGEEAGRRDPLDVLTATSGDEPADGRGHSGQALPQAGGSDGSGAPCSEAAPAADDTVPEAKGLLDHMPEPMQLPAPGRLSWRRICSGRVLVLALLINALLVCLFAAIMYLDRPMPPRQVYYINLSDRPDSADGAFDDGRAPLPDGAAAATEAGGTEGKTGSGPAAGEIRP